MSDKELKELVASFAVSQKETAKQISTLSVSQKETELYLFKNFTPKDFNHL